MLDKWEEQLDQGGSLQYKQACVDDDTMAKFNNMRGSLKPVTITDFRMWALNSARVHELLEFKASSTWLSTFKKKHRISQRRVTRFVSNK